MATSQSPSSHPAATGKPYPTTLPPTAATAGAATATAGTLTSISTILAAGAPLAATVAALVTVLGAVGISVAVAQVVAYLALTGVAVGMVSGPAGSTMSGIELRFRAAYLLRAAQRLQAGVNQGIPLAQLLKTELRYFKLHQAAQRNRRRSARQVDAMAKQTGSDLLGWKAVLDQKTTPECREADGKNFFPAYPPAIGYPGSVHVSCRCKAVPAFVGAEMVDRVTSPVRVLQAA